MAVQLAMHRSSASLTIQNNGATDLKGPVTVVVDRLRNGVLVNRTGITQQGSPYLTLDLAALRPGARQTVTLRFRKTGRGRLGFAARVFSGRVLH